MEIVEWANGNGITLQATKTEAEALWEALGEALISGKGNAVLETTEIDVEIQEGD